MLIDLRIDNKYIIYRPTHVVTPNKLDTLNEPYKYIKLIITNQYMLN